MTERPILLDPESEAQFWSRVTKAADGDCWLWTGPRHTRQKYGLLRMNGFMVSAHRVAWTIINGDLPFEHRLIATCGVQHCVNPAHRELVNPRDPGRNRGPNGGGDHSKCDHDNTKAARKLCRAHKKKEGN